MVYTSSGNVPYVKFESVGDFIPEPRCSKFAVGLQTEESKMGGARGPVRLVVVLDRGVLNQLVNLNCVPLIPDGDAKRHKVYTGSGN